MSISETNNPPTPTGSLEVALTHASRLLEHSPALAAEQANEILRAVPNHPPAVLLLAVARRSMGEVGAALEILQALTASQPNWAAGFYELGVSYGSVGGGAAAVTALRRAVRLKPDLSGAWRALGDHLTAMGDNRDADAAYAQHIKSSTRDPSLLAPAAALCENRIPEAEALLRAHLKQFPTDVAAIRMLAEVAGRLGRYADAANLLARCLELAPSFVGARQNYAQVLQRQNKSFEAMPHVDWLLEREPRNPSHRNLKAAVLASVGDYDGSIRAYTELMREYPRQAKIWMSFGHTLKTAGRERESIAAYRKSIELAPELGESYWSLANLKTLRFSADDLNAMRAQLQVKGLSDEDRIHFNFAAGKALEDASRFSEAFAHYQAGNQLHRARISYSAEQTSARVRRTRTLLTREFFEQRAGFGCEAPDPIFIVGLPRSGSTLLEQILSSHSAVEGTMELPDIPVMAQALTKRRADDQDADYPAVLAGLSAEQCRAMGEQYIRQTRLHRKTGTAFFIDKLPNNFIFIGLIRLILPNAKIIDARRHPLGCCFSGFKQHFARGQHFTYDLTEIGRYYHDYVALMAHFDAVLPGRIHRVIYEDLIEHTEARIRDLLTFCGLPFEEHTLRFYENSRAVRTPSSQQVRQPIFREGVDQWRHFEQHLTPLKEALGPVLDAYPDAPGD
jgi:tetratricopeptide (TPR) repeat protein